jgi:biopolymer transport protein ExbD
MAVNKGLQRLLPPIPTEEQKQEDMKVKERNLLVVLINSQDDLMVNKKPMQLADLRAAVKEFVQNPANDPNMPEKKEITVDLIGNISVTKDHIISLQNDRGTSYAAYINVQNELVSAYNELRNELSKAKFAKNFEDLDSEQQKAIQKIYPQKISEAEPKNYGGKK